MRACENENKHLSIHVGSDTDNNCLMASLIQIFLRPHCRTIKGFCELIVREWIVRGHPFRERFGQVLSDVYGSPAQEVCSLLSKKIFYEKNHCISGTSIPSLSRLCISTNQPKPICVRIH